MKKILVSFIIFLNFIYASQDTTNQIQENSDKEEVEKTPNDTLNNDANKKNDFTFSPAPILKESYGSFMVGYEMLIKKSGNFKEQKQGIYFALDKGWNFIDNILLFGFSLDGTAGSFYSVNINTKIGARILDGRLIPSVSFGYGLLNHIVDNTQYNLHGANATVSFFVDIVRGFGIEASYRVGLHPFSVTKKNSNIRVRNINAFMINLKFIDFSI